MGFGGALHRTNKHGKPWMPPWWFSFVVLPLLVIASFYTSQLTGWRGVASPSVEGVPLSEVSSDGLIPYVVRYLAFYFAIVLPVFLVRRRFWNKHQTEDSSPTS